MRILLVDDHAIVRRGLRQLLAEAWPAAEFGEADRLPAAREALAGEPWDLVLLDINLPDGSGLDLLAQARQRCPGTPVLVLSAHAEEAFALRAFKLGAAGYLAKASLADEVLLAVRQVLAGERYVSVALAEHLVNELGHPQPALRHETLSRRELEVLRRVAAGQTARQIAADLQLSEKTIATYRSRLTDKLGLSTNVELALYAQRHALVG